MHPDQTFLDAGVYRERAARAGRGDLLALPPARDAEVVLALYWSRDDVRPFLPVETAPGPAVHAEVHRGAWIACCPLCGLGAQYASRTDPRFLCLSCLNEAAGFAWLPVEWPADPAAIEGALRPRMTDNANYVPGETVADLHAENAANGVSLSEVGA